MDTTTPGQDGSTGWADHIPVLWLEPASRRPGHPLFLCLGGLSGTKEGTLPFLRDMAARGFVAVGFDAWQHGERGAETREQISKRVFGSFRRHMWPIMGQTALDTLRVIDWAVDALKVAPPVRMLGLSMGGDIATAVAGIDHRITRVATIASTPDWLRPGMRGAGSGDAPMPQGEPDAYPRYFYDHLNPLTHLEAYAHHPALRFVCGGRDDHVPPDGAERFQRALAAMDPSAAGSVEVKLIPGKGHMDLVDPGLWWPETLEWLSRE